ncbi:hypothetical protein PV328_002404 [Microctonus aethiopoides]|uniref:La-related protein 7 n=1 Tax=Microctonus aethiopoides TaxID=144406 RepID=A0AA39F6C7_9HYME|nr:hypothetical protein PV328_002404 [Microctonus aethiopoides]
MPINCSVNRKKCGKSQNITMVMEEQKDSSGLAAELVIVPKVHHTLLAANTATMNEEKDTMRSGKPRLRKKALHAQILKQMEFYFSDANLSKDRFLGNLISTDPYVDLNVFLRCNKIRELTLDKTRIAKALQTSTILSLSEDKTKVCRTTAINSRENCDACTIYAQGLPPNTDHAWLNNIFSQYGSVAYVSIPRYKTNRKLKGFAFIEFETIEGAEKCLKAFHEKNCTLPPHTDPNELLSITTFSEDDPPNELDDDSFGSKPIAQEIKVSKRSAQSDDNLELESDNIKSKKARLQCVNNEKIESDGEASDENTNVDGMNVDDDKDNNGEKDEKRKKSRRRKRRGRAEQPDIIDFGLHIMAKKDWKKLRNKYLQLQRNKMKQLKQHLRKTRWNQLSTHERRDKKEIEEPINEMKEPISTPKFMYAEGLIVKIELDELCSNPKSLKHEFRGETGIQYIDVKEGTNYAYIRCDTAATANNFMKKYGDEKILTILYGEEETAYWNKMEKDREEKLGKKNRVKQRGRDKLLKKAEKELGKHIKFDEV